MQQIISTIAENGDPIAGVTQNIDGEAEGELASNCIVTEKNGKRYHVTFKTIYSKKEVDE